MRPGLLAREPVAANADTVFDRYGLPGSHRKSDTVYGATDSRSANSSLCCSIYRYQ